MQDLPRRRFAAFLFDMDGTLLDSIAAANRVWRHWAERHGIDPAPMMATMHGVRAIDTVRRWAPPGADIEREAAGITLAEIEDVDGVMPIGGARAFVDALPAGRWAIVTSAPRALAERRLAAAGLPVPPVFVTAEDVDHGKPRPDCYRLAARLLGVDPADCLVWEDVPAGIAAGEAAGASVIVVSATHHAPMVTPHPVVADYEGLSVVIDDAGWLTLAARG